MRYDLEDHKPLKDAQLKLTELEKQVADLVDAPQQAVEDARAGKVDKMSTFCWHSFARWRAIESERARKRQGHGETAPGRTLRETFPEASKGRARDKVAATVGLGSIERQAVTLGRVSTGGRGKPWGAPVIDRGGAFTRIFASLL